MVYRYTFLRCSARADAVVSSSKNARLINQLKCIQVECGALLKQLVEMREQLEELAVQKSQFCKQVAELQDYTSTVCRKRDATVCPCEATQVDVELFQSQAENLECEKCELNVSRKHRHGLAAWRQPHNLVGRKANTYHWCRKWHTSQWQVADVQWAVSRRLSANVHSSSLTVHESNSSNLLNSSNRHC